jgi:uncharacterized delta-60 repeat protein
MPDGSPDPTFGTGGLVATGFGAPGAMVLAPDGRIVVGGASPQPPDQRDAFMLTRYDVDGTPDPTFGNGGVVTTQLYRLPHAVSALALRSDGRIVATGVLRLGGPANRTRTVIASYTAAGEIDLSFGVRGKRRVAVGSVSVPSFVGSLGGGGTLVAGHWFRSANYGAYTVNGLMLIRLTPEGKLDRTFGRLGKVLPRIDAAVATGAGVLQADGKPVLAGFSTLSGGFGDFFLARFLP